MTLIEELYEPVEFVDSQHIESKIFPELISTAQQVLSTD
jgi:hypothetical protein